MGFETKNDSTGEDQQQISGLKGLSKFVLNYGAKKLGAHSKGSIFLSSNRPHFKTRKGYWNE
jgi:hypothetical protein